MKVDKGKFCVALGMCVGLLLSGDNAAQKLAADTSADKKAVEKLQIMPPLCPVDVDLLPYL